MKNEHNFNPAIEKTSVELAQIFLKNFIDNFSVFVYEINDETKSPEFVKEKIEKITDFTIHLMAVMAATDIPADYATWCIEKIIASMQVVKDNIDGRLREYNDETLSRFYGRKSPLTDSYAKDMATLGDIMLGLNRVRQETGNNPEDYAWTKKPVEEENKKE